ncbi:MAG TPA: 2-oxoacid:acceptor oxidoreductase subunit alpha [Thermoflexales bacterium]|nr:2-oxoacid:acceptor oxidoreductase subunit alpha [Thermoflexales bacterium]HQW35403.1 2-oxoacid:acceptor oxidoreductase subunit alpha [Thermoflexales bacterium]HQZ21133.1 2-oxoacid:acceptor oxidoreductase subunit alpha [Thermoflexales bacterium]
MSETAQTASATIVNDFSIMAATKNGSGSQTANLTILRTLFKMGIPVNGKNVFPSNIQGQPTWYWIRASKDGYLARTDEADIVISLNPDSAIYDYASVKSGGAFIYAEDLKMSLDRKDVSHYPIPTRKIANALETDVRLRSYGANMVYVGGLAWLLGIDLKVIESSLMFHFNGKAKPVQSNMKLVTEAYNWAAANWKKTDPYRVEPMDKTAGQIMIDGNTASALGAVYGGVSFIGWYPITPATGVADGLGEFLPKLRTDPETGKPTYAIVQAEDELAALGMVIGAGWMGARAMTSTSGPGISLMAEFTGYAYFAEIPAVIVDVTRMGPSTGLPTRVSQGDVMKAYFLGHGDVKNICLLPGNVGECFEHGWKAFDIAEHIQTPVFVLSDLDLGMNNHMSQPFAYPDKPMDRGKVLSADDLTRLKGFARYRDVDGDAIGWRTLPGTDHPLAAYFTRGTGHNERAAYSEKSADWQGNLDRLARKHETARTLLDEVAGPVIEQVDGAEIAIISYGSNDFGVQEARARLAKEGHKISYLRVRALPLSNSIKDFVAKHKRVYVVEMNQDAQMRALLQLHMPDQATKLIAANVCDGLPLTAKWISGKILEEEKKA